jgi:hypothetical protein
MQNTFGSGFVQRADGLLSVQAGSFQVLVFDGLAGLLHIGAGAATEDAIVGTAFLILPVSFHCRSGISQR